MSWWHGIDGVGVGLAQHDDIGSFHRHSVQLCSIRSPSCFRASCTNTPTAANMPSIASSSRPSASVHRCYHVPLPHLGALLHLDKALSSFLLPCPSLLTEELNYNSKTSALVFPFQASIPDTTFASLKSNAGTFIFQEEFNLRRSSRYCDVELSVVQ